MYRTMLKSKIHRATVTQADLHYVGSVTVDATLMEAADLLPGEQVSIVDVSNGSRLDTYVITGERDSGVLGINGAAAHLVHPGDLVILIAYGIMENAEATAYQPKIVFVDGDNGIVQAGADAAHAPEASGLLSGAVTISPQASAPEDFENAPDAFPVAETVDAAKLDALLHVER